jgi:hypothetical protein
MTWLSGISVANANAVFHHGAAVVWRVMLGGGPDTGTDGTAPPPTPTQPVAPETGFIVVLISGGFALLGFFLGASAALLALIIVGAAFVFIPWQWSFIVTWAIRFFNLLMLPFIKLGLAKPVPPELGQAAASGPVTAGSLTAVWQVGVFLFAVLLAYMAAAVAASVMRRTPGGYRPRVGCVDRLMGSLFGAITGLFIAAFTLPRLLANANVMPFRPPAPTGPEGSPGLTIAVLIALLIFVLYGVISLGSRKKQEFS